MNKLTNEQREILIARKKEIAAKLDRLNALQAQLDLIKKYRSQPTEELARELAKLV